jgi:HEAT repeat protein
MLWWTLRCLRSKNPKTREKATRKLGAFTDPRALKVLVATLGDKADNVCVAATEELVAKGKGAIEPLLAAMKDGETEVRERAAEALGRIRDHRAVETLVAALKEKKPVIRRKAVKALGSIGDVRAVESLLAGLKDDDCWVRALAAEALGEIGDARAIDPLVAALIDSWEKAREAAANALQRIDVNWAETETGRRAVPTLAGGLNKHGAPEVRRAAAKSLGKIGGASAIEHLAAALKDNDPEVQCEAAYALGKAGSTAVEPLVIVLTDEDSGPRVRSVAARALVSIRDPRAVDALVIALKHERVKRRMIGYMGDPDVLQAAAEGLGEIGDARAIEPLIEALVTGKENVRTAAANALKQIDPNWTKTEAAKHTVPFLAGHLRGSGSLARQAAAETLSKIGDTRAIEPLVVALPDDDSFTRWAVREALNVIDPDWPKSEAAKRAIRALVEALVGQEEARPKAAKALELIDPNWPKTEAAKLALPTLVEALTHWAESVRKEAVEALGKIGDVRAVEPLIEKLYDSDIGVCREAANALGKIRDVRAVEPLVRLFKDHGRCLQEHASHALIEIGDARAVEPLVAALADQWSEVRQMAIAALEHIDPDWWKSEAAQAAVPALAIALGNQDMTVRQAAVDALYKIGGPAAVQALRKTDA